MQFKIHQNMKVESLGSLPQKKQKQKQKTGFSLSILGAKKPKISSSPSTVSDYVVNTGL